MNEIVSRFRQYLVDDGKAAATVDSYAGDAEGFAAWLESRGAWFDGRMSRSHVTAYRRHLAEAGFQVSTTNKKINSLRCLNLWLIGQGLTPELVVNLRQDKARVADGSEREVDVFTDDEVDRIAFLAADRARASDRDGAVMTLLLYTGLRVSELTALTLQDADLLGMRLTVRGKGGKLREVPLRAEAVDAVREYIEGERRSSPHAGSKFLLLTQRAGRMDRDTVNKLLRRHGAAIGVVMKPHKFRHTFCSRLVKRGVPLTTVARLAGHASVQTTAKFYVNTSRQEKVEAVNLL